MTATQANQIAALIELRDAANEIEAARIQKQIDEIFDPIDAAMESASLVAQNQNFPHIALLGR